MIKYQDILTNKEINDFIEAADDALSVIKFTEHGYKHVKKVAVMVEEILTNLECDAKTIELGKIAAYMHDIGNVINRINHSQSGAMLSYCLLQKMGMDTRDICKVIEAIGNHDESAASIVSQITAALILADKSDVRRTRVHNKDINSFDIHHRVNYSVTGSNIKMNMDKKTVTLNLIIDQKFCSIMDYFEIFTSRMLLCKKAAAFLGLTFHLIINNQLVL